MRINKEMKSVANCKSFQLPTSALYLLKFTFVLASGIFFSLRRRQIELQLWVSSLHHLEDILMKD